MIKYKKDPPLDSQGGFIEEDIEYCLKSINWIEDFIQIPGKLLNF